MAREEGWISQAEYCRRNKINPNTFKQLVASGELEAIRLDSGYYKVKIDSKDTVSREKYEKLLEEKIALETKVKSVLSILERKEST